MTLMAWLWIGLSILGAIVLAVVIWLAGPLVSIGDVQPFDSAIVRLIIILAICSRGRRRHRLAHHLAPPRRRQDRRGDDRDCRRG